MRFTTPFTALRNATSDIWRMHDFNYQLPKDQRQDYWEKECIDHPTSSHCKVYWRQYKTGTCDSKVTIHSPFPRKEFIWGTFK